MAYKIETNALVKESFETAKRHWKPLIGVMAVMWAFGMLNYLLVGNRTGIFSFVVSLLIAIPMAIVGAGAIRLCVGIVKGKAEPFSIVFSGADVLIPFVVASLLYNRAVIVGVLLLVVPGIVLSVKLGFFSYFVADGRLGAVDALKKSYAVTQGQFWDLTLLAAVLLVLNLVGALAFGIGLLVTVPMTMLIAAKVYVGLKDA